MFFKNNWHCLRLKNPAKKEFLNAGSLVESKAEVLPVYPYYLVNLRNFVRESNKLTNAHDKKAFFVSQLPDAVAVDQKAAAGFGGYAGKPRMCGRLDCIGADSR